MCTIERFDVVYPDGRRETRERVVNCPRGTRSRPCSNTEVVHLFEDHHITGSDLNPIAGPAYHENTSRGSESSRSRPGSREKPKSLLEEFALSFKNPFSSKKPKTKMYLVHRKERPRNDQPAIIHPYPRAPSPPRRREMDRPPLIVPVEPQQRRRGHTPPPTREREPRRRRRHNPQQIEVHQVRPEARSPSPPKPAREHHRRARSTSSTRKGEAEEKLVQERERRQYAERVAREEYEARRRAERVAEYERLQRERARQDRIEFEERKRLESAERTRRRQQQEEYERTQAKRRQELEDIRRLNLRDRAQRRRDEQDRLRREERDRNRREEENRLDRARRAHIPRQPRHEPALHHQRESMEDRGERFIREAIRQENLRQFERQAPPNAGRPRRTYDDDRLRRRGDVDDGHHRWR